MKYVAFLRGINVGGRYIKMSDLNTCFESLGLEEVKTVLQTGNVIFTSDSSARSLKDLIETGLTKSFNYPAKIQVIKFDNLLKIIKDRPFNDIGDENHDYVIFFENGLEKQLIDEVTDLDQTVEKVEPGNGVIYWRVPKGSTLSSQFAKNLTKAKYKNFNTNRNVNTLLKLID
jgi:uncharacterized protein (DUF1697 family)